MRTLGISGTHYRFGTKPDLTNAPRYELDGTAGVVVKRDRSTVLFRFDGEDFTRVYLKAEFDSKFEKVGK